MNKPLPLARLLACCLVFSLALVISCSENRASKQNSVTNNPDSLIGKKTYVNPVDGKSYTTDGEYKEYTPEGGVKTKSGPVQPLNVVLLTEQSKIPAIISIDELAEFIKGVDSVVIKQLSDVKDTGQIILQFTLFSDKKAKVAISYQGSIKTEHLNELSKKIEVFSFNIRTQKDSCVFQSVYGLNEGRK